MKAHVLRAITVCLTVMTLISGPAALLAQNTQALRSLPDEKQTALDAVMELEAEIHDMAMKLWDYSETALLEARSAEFLADMLGGVEPEALGSLLMRDLRGRIQPPPPDILFCEPCPA